MTAVAILVALASMGVSGYSLFRQKVISKQLDRERAEKLELRETLVEVLDEEGTIRGQLALPGQPVGSRVSERLALAERSVSTIQDEIRNQTKKLRDEVEGAAADLREAKGALEAARSREEYLEKTLAEVVDSDGEVLVQLRLPGEREMPPNKTPCGDMCKLAVFNQDKKWDHRMGRYIKAQVWVCVAGQNRPCDDVRSQFVGADGQCVLFERDDDC